MSKEITDSQMVSFLFFLYYSRSKEPNRVCSSLFELKEQERGGEREREISVPMFKY